VKECEKENTEVKNYEMVIEAWKENRTISRFPSAAQRQLPGYMRKTISSLSKSKKIL
jgi:hypothetical protein